MATWPKALKEMVVYMLKVVGANSLRVLASAVLKMQKSPQATPPKPAKTVYIDRKSSTNKKRPPLQVDVYLPSKQTEGDDSALAVIVNAHGSGFVLSEMGQDAPFAQLMADQVHCVVLDVAYSKAPENPFPNANEDIERVIEWVAEGKEAEKKLKVNVDARRIALTGFSSGGNLALTTCVRAKAAGVLDRIRAVVAFYPSTNLAESPYEKPQVRQAKGEAGAFLPPYVRYFLYSCYIPASQDTPRSSPIISPINAAEDCFPPSVTIFTCQGDSLAREAQQTARNIQQGRQAALTSERVLNETATNGVLWWEAEGQGHSWDKMCKQGSGSAQKRDYAYALSAERLKAALHQH